MKLAHLVALFGLCALLREVFSELSVWLSVWDGYTDTGIGIGTEG